MLLLAKTILGHANMLHRAYGRDIHHRAVWGTDFFSLPRLTVPRRSFSFPSPPVSMLTILAHAVVFLSRQKERDGDMT